MTEDSLIAALQEFKDRAAIQQSHTPDPKPYQHNPYRCIQCKKNGAVL